MFDIYIFFILITNYSSTPCPEHTSQLTRMLVKEYGLEVSKE